MKLSLEREIDLHVEEELLVPKDEPLDLDQPQEEIHGVEESTHAKPNIKLGKRRTTEAERLKLDATEKSLHHSVGRDRHMIDLLDTWLS